MPDTGTRGSLTTGRRADSMPAGMGARAWGWDGRIPDAGSMRARGMGADRAATRGDAAGAAIGPRGCDTGACGCTGG
jgi:hypothetical protein